MLAEPQADAGAQYERNQIGQEQGAEALAREHAVVAHPRVPDAEQVAFRRSEAPVFRRQLVGAAAPVVKEIGILKPHQMFNNAVLNA